MKTNPRYLIPALGLLVALMPSLQAGETQPEAKREKRVIVLQPGSGAAANRHIEFIGEDGPGEMETVTFLGVQTEPVDPTLRTQLGIAPGTGLVVGTIVPDSAAAGALQEHDVLLKLDDQILVNIEQLSVLVRNKQAGDKVVLTYLRGGKEAKATVTLTQHEVAKHTMLKFNQRLGPTMQWHALPGSAAASGSSPDNLLWMMEMGHEGGARRVVRTETEDDGNMVFVSLDTGRSTLKLKDEAGELELMTKDGKKMLNATDPDGKVIFNGPVDTDEEKAKLPAGLGARLEKLEKMPSVQFQRDGEIKTETKVLELKRPDREARVERDAKPMGLRRLDVS